MADELTTIQQLKLEMQKFVDERNWSKFQNMRSLAISLSLESNELLDHFQWLSDKEVDDYVQVPKNKIELEAELADIFAYILISSCELNFDLTAKFLEKLEKNKQKYPKADFKELAREEGNKKYQEKRQEWEYANKS